MKITAQAVGFLSGILSTCMFEKGYIFSKEQEKFLEGLSSHIAFGDFLQVFPLEEETGEKLVSLALSKKRDAIDSEVVLAFFGGDMHIDHAREDIAENGLTGILASLFLVFHVVIAVQLERRDGQIIGKYRNQDLEFEFRGLEVMENFTADLSGPNKTFLVHYGSVFGSVLVGSIEEGYLLEAQSQSQFFKETCRKIKFLDCEKMLNALQFKKRSCHVNLAR